MNAGVMAAVLSTLVVLTSVAAYIQYTHASEYKDVDARKRIAQYMVVAAVFMVVGLVFAPIACFQAGVWATRDGVPKDEAAANVAFMSPVWVYIFYGLIGVIVLANCIMSIRAHRTDITGYEQEESPLFNLVEWGKVGNFIAVVMLIVFFVALFLMGAIFQSVHDATKRARIDPATGVALSMLSSFNRRR